MNSIFYALYINSSAQEIEIIDLVTPVELAPSEEEAGD